MKLFRRPRFGLPPRSWFQDSDGTYFRNIVLVLGEQRECLRLMACNPLAVRRASQLSAEFDVLWREGIVRKDHLDPGDKLVQMGRFRDVYPDKPGLWVLDRDDERITS